MNICGALLTSIITSPRTFAKTDDNQFKGDKPYLFISNYKTFHIIGGRYNVDFYIEIESINKLKIYSKDVYLMFFR